jgi:hypothetical protein
VFSSMSCIQEEGMSSLSSEGEQGSVRRTGHRRVDRVDAAFVQRHLVTWRIMHERYAEPPMELTLHFTSLAPLSQPCILSPHIYFDEVSND